MITIPADTVHRTRARGRTVNLTFEHLDAVTDIRGWSGLSHTDFPEAGSAATLPPSQQRARTRMRALFQCLRSWRRRFIVRVRECRRVLAQRSRDDRRELLDELVAMLSEVVPGVQVERALLRRHVKSIRLPLGGYIYELKRLPDDSVRGESAARSARRRDPR